MLARSLDARIACTSFRKNLLRQLQHFSTAATVDVALHFVSELQASSSGTSTSGTDLQKQYELIHIIRTRMFPCLTCFAPGI